MAKDGDGAREGYEHERPPPLTYSGTILSPSSFTRTTHLTPLHSADLYDSRLPPCAITEDDVFIRDAPLE